MGRKYLRISSWVLLLGFSVTFMASPSKAQQALPVKVSPLLVNGPADQAYLGEAARDAIVGSLIQQGWAANSLTKILPPEKLASAGQGGKDTGLLVTGRLNVVGSQVTALLKWINASGQTGQAYLPASHVDQLLPQLEKFTSQQWPTPSVFGTAKQMKEEQRSTWERAKVTPPPSQAQTQQPVQTFSPGLPLPAPRETASIPEKSAPVPSSSISAAPLKPTKKGHSDQRDNIPLRDYQYVSERLPFEVRSVAYGDVNGDGAEEVLMTSERTLYVYSFENRQLKLLSEYAGSKLDYFVKVQLWKESTQGSLIVLTVLRQDQAVSRLLRYSGGQFSTVVENQPYALRVIKSPQGEAEQLLGSYYTPSHKTGVQSIVPLTLQGNTLVKAERLNLPREAGLYYFTWVQIPGSSDPGVVTLSEEGKLRLYQKEKGRYRRIWTSRGNYGDSGNYVPVKIKDFFNETVGDYYSIPVAIQSFVYQGRPEIVVVKNTSLVQGVIGRVPLIADGQIFRLTWDAMGFIETWRSKKVDGGIQDLLVNSDGAGSQIMAALKLRDPGLLGQIERNDSVLLLYDL